MGGVKLPADQSGWCAALLTSGYCRCVIKPSLMMTLNCSRRTVCTTYCTYDEIRPTLYSVHHSCKLLYVVQCTAYDNRGPVNSTSRSSLANTASRRTLYVLFIVYDVQFTYWVVGQSIYVH